MVHICILCCDRYNVGEQDIWIKKGKEDEYPCGIDTHPVYPVYPIYHLVCPHLAAKSFRKNVLI